MIKAQPQIPLDDAAVRVTYRPQDAGWYEFVVERGGVKSGETVRCASDDEARQRAQDMIESMST